MANEFKVKNGLISPNVILQGSSGTTTLIPTSVASGTITFPAATGQVVLRDTTDTLTNKSLSDSTTYFTDNLTPLKKFQFQASSIGGSGATFTVNTNGIGQVTAVNLVTAGSGYQIGDYLQFDSPGSPTTTAKIYINNVSSTGAIVGIFQLPGEGAGYTANQTGVSAAVSYYTYVDRVFTVPSISGTLALTGNTLGSFSSTTSSELASVISDETGSGSLVFSAGPTFTGTANFAALSTTGNVIVGGDLTVNGTTTTVNSTTTTLDDPIITLGGDNIPVSDDNKDRGVEFRWFDPTANGGTGAARVGFFGYDDSASKFTFIPNATNSSEVFSGTVGAFDLSQTGSINGLTISSSTGTLTIANSKTLTVSNTLTFTGTDSSSVAFGTGGTVLYNGGALGTPSSGTLTNCSGLPVSGITSSTSTALGVGTLELGHASDTTIARSAAGVITVEGVVVPTISSTNTLTNKSLSDSTTFFIDEADNTKKMQFQLSGITTANTRTLTIPDVSGTLITTGDTSTVTNTMLAGSIANSKLTNSSITINGSNVSLGGTITVSATAANALTIGTGLSGTSYNGGSAVTIAIDNTVALRADTHYIGTTAVALNRASANLALTGINSVTFPGSTSGTVQLIPAAVAGTSTVLTMPATTGTVVTTGDSGTVTNTMLAGSIANSKLTNSSITVNGQSISLGSSGTITATATNALTISTGLSGTSYNGGSAVTIAIDSTVATLTGSQTLTNKTIAAGSNTISGLTNSNLSGTAGITNANLANSSVTVTAGTGMGGGGSVALGGSITLTNAGVTSLSVGGGLSLPSGGTGAVILSTNATSANTASTIVSRDASGNFAANIVTLGVDAAITAAGSTQGTGTALTKAINNVTTVAASTGVVLPTAVAGYVIIVRNGGANALNVYPASGAAINAGAANAAHSLPVSAMVQYVAMSSTQWYTMSSTYA